VRRHNLAVVSLPDFREKNVIHFLSHGSARAISAMIEDEQAGIDLIGDRGELDRRRMIPAAELLELR
jgi:hypothetical protein